MAYQQLTSKTFYFAFADFDVTNLHSLAAGDIWGAAAVTNAAAAGASVADSVEVFYDLDLAGAFAADDYVAFALARGDADSTEIWTGGVSEAQAQITAAADTERAVQAHAGGWMTHYGSANHSTAVSGNALLSLPGPDWKLLMEVSSNSLAASGSVVRWRYVSRRTVD